MEGGLPQRPPPTAWRRVDAKHRYRAPFERGTRHLMRENGQASYGASASRRSSGQGLFSPVVRSMKTTTI